VLIKKHCYILLCEALLFTCVLFYLLGDYGYHPYHILGDISIILLWIAVNLQQYKCMQVLITTIELLVY